MVDLDSYLVQWAWTVIRYGKLGRLLGVMGLGSYWVRHAWTFMRYGRLGPFLRIVQSVIDEQDRSTKCAAKKNPLATE